MLPLGFRFEVDAVVVSGVAHRKGCDQAAQPLPHQAILVSADEVHRAERCPDECPSCRPPFETLLSYQLERPAPPVPV